MSGKVRPQHQDCSCKLQIQDCSCKSQIQPLLEGSHGRGGIAAPFCVGGRKSKRARGAFRRNGWEEKGTGGRSSVTRMMGVLSQRSRDWSPACRRRDVVQFNVRQPDIAYLISSSLSRILKDFGGAFRHLGFQDGEKRLAWLPEIRWLNGSNLLEICTVSIRMRCLSLHKTRETLRCVRLRGCYRPSTTNFWAQKRLGSTRTSAFVDRES